MVGPLSSRPVSPIRGRVLLLLSALSFALMGLAAKSIPAPVGSHEKVFFRSLVGTLLILGWIVARHRKVGRPVNYQGLFLRGSFGAASLLCFFYAIDHVGLTKATLYCYTYPVWAAVIAWFDRDERPSGVVVGWLVVAMAGVLLTLDPAGAGATGPDWLPAFGKGDIVGLVGGMLSGAAITSVRRLHRTETSLWIVLAFTGISTVAAVPFMAPSYVTPAPLAAGLLLATGIFAVAAQSFMTSGYRHVRAVEGSVLGLSIVPMSALLGALFLGEKLGGRFWLGAALVLAAAIGSSLHMIRKQRTDTASPSEKETFPPKTTVDSRPA